MSCLSSFIILFIVIFIIIIIGQFFWCKERIVQYFTDLNTKFPIYTELKNSLNEMKINNIGEPPGILDFSSNQECDTDKNLLIQSNVSFRQSRTKNGCTHVNKIWPG